MRRQKTEFMAGLICLGLLLCSGPFLMGQDDEALLPDEGLPGSTMSEESIEQQGIRVQPKRLKDYGIPGLDAVVNLKSIEPWDIVQLIEFLAYRGGIKNIVVGKGVSGMTTKLKFENVSVGDALEVVLSVNNLSYEVKGGIVTIMTDEEYQQLYGTSFYDNKQVKVVDLKYADPVRVATMLQPLKSTIGTVVSDPITGTLILIDTPEKIREMQVIVEKTDISTVSRVMPTETKTFNLQYADVDTLNDEISKMLTPDIGNVRAGRRTKTLIVTDLPHSMKEIEEVIAVFDRRLKQVFIEAKIVEVNLNEEFRMGVQWDHVVQGIDPRFRSQTTVNPVAGALGGSLPSAGSLSYQSLIGDGVLNATIDALKTVGDTKILSNPHVAVVSGEEATIKVVTDQPYAEAQLESGSTNVVGESIQFIEVGVILSVTPQINDENMISMMIKPEVSSVIGNYPAFRSVPIIQKAYAETTVMIKHGETVIIAGMIRNEKNESQSRVPFLGRVPLLGWLFKSEGDTSTTKETIVFLSPRIITGEEPVLLMRDQKKRPKPLRAVGTSSRRKTLKPVR